MDTNQQDSAAAVPAPEVDDFDAAFDAALGAPAPNAAPVTATPGPASDEGGEAATPAVAATPAADAAATPTPDPTPDPGEGAPVPAVPAAPAAQAVDATPAPAPAPVDVAALAEAIRQANAPAPAAPAPYVPPAGPEAYYSEDDKALFARIQKDWGDDVIRAINISQRAAIRYALEINQAVSSEQLAPLYEVINRVQVESHEAKLERAHPGYRELVPAIDAWIGAQPTGVKERLKQLRDEGTTEEVIGLLDLFKANTGRAGAAPAAPAPAAQTPAAPAAAPAVVVNQHAQAVDELAQALAATAVVRTQRAAQPTVPDTSDFDAAFAEASSK